MNPRNTGILLLVALGFGAFLYLTEIRGEDERAEQEAESKRLFPDVDASSIDWIVLQTPDGEARIERRPNGWHMTAPVDFPADAREGDSLASNLAELGQEVELEDPAQPDEYGLGSTAGLVRFGVEGNERAIRFGRETPLGPNSYAMIDGAESIVTLPTFRVRSFDKSLLDLRNKAILDFDMGAVTRFDTRWPGGNVTIEKRGGEDDTSAPMWFVTAPMEGRADFEAVRDLLSTLSSLRADGFVDSPSEESLASFDAASFDVTLGFDGSDGGEARSLRLTIGGMHEGDKRLVRGSESSLYTIPADRLADFPREVVAYRYRKLSEFAINDAQRLDLYFQPNTGDPVAITAERGGEGWTSSPEATAPGKLARLVSELSSLEAADIVSEGDAGGDLASLGLAPPNAILSVLGAPVEGAEGSPRLAEIHLGNVEGSEWILARAVGDTTVYRLDYELAEHLPVSLDAFRSRFLADEEPEPSPDSEPEDLSPGEESP